MVLANPSYSTALGHTITPLRPPQHTQRPPATAAVAWPAAAPPKTKNFAHTHTHTHTHTHFTHTTPTCNCCRSTADNCAWSSPSSPCTPPNLATTSGAPPTRCCSMAAVDASLLSPCMCLCRCMLLKFWVCSCLGCVSVSMRQHGCCGRFVAATLHVFV